MRSGNSSIENIAIVQTCCLYDHHHFVECFSAIVCIVTQIPNKCIKKVKSEKSLNTEKSREEMSYSDSAIGSADSARS